MKANQFVSNGVIKVISDSLDPSEILKTNLEKRLNTENIKNNLHLNQVVSVTIEVLAVEDMSNKDGDLVSSEASRARKIRRAKVSNVSVSLLPDEQFPVVKGSTIAISEAHSDLFAEEVININTSMQREFSVEKEDKEAKALKKAGKHKIMREGRTHFLTLEPIGCDSNHYVFSFKDHLTSEYGDILFNFERQLKKFEEVKGRYVSEIQKL
jgi:hypothetical protein